MHQPSCCVALVVIARASLSFVGWHRSIREIVACAVRVRGDWHASSRGMARQWRGHGGCSVMASCLCMSTIFISAIESCVGCDTRSCACSRVFFSAFMCVFWCSQFIVTIASDGCQRSGVKMGWVAEPACENNSNGPGPLFLEP